MGRKPNEGNPHLKSLSLYDLWVKKSDAKHILKKLPNSIPFLPDSERATMLKLILGMAVDSYNYDPDQLRNDATGSNRGSIKASLEEIGLTIDEETVRKYLREGKDLYPEVKTKTKNKTLQA